MITRNCFVQKFVFVTWLDVDSQLEEEWASVLVC